jgi:hypothetical protein
LGVLLSFGLAHIGLRFKLHAMDQHTNAMQQTQQTLNNSINSLRGETEKLKSPDALLAYARNELNMEYAMGERETIRMPEQIHTLYAIGRAEIEDRELAAGRSELERRIERQGELWLGVVGERVGLFGTAQAGEKPAEKKAEPAAEPKPAAEADAGEKKAERKAGKTAGKPRTEAKREAKATAH